jgi:hypothetical protein
MLELHHAGTGQKQGRVCQGHQGGAWDHLMTLFLKKMEEYLPDFVASHFLPPELGNVLLVTFPILV